MLTLVGDTAGAYEKLMTAREIFERVGGLATVEDIDRDLEDLSPQATVRSIRGA